MNVLSSSVWLNAMAAGCLAALIGCDQSAAPIQSHVASSGGFAQLQEVSMRVGSLDANNRELHFELAQSHRREQTLKEEVLALKQKVQERTVQLKAARASMRRGEKTSQASPAPIASIVPNTNRSRALTTASVAGANVRREGDLVRIRVPATRLFTSDSTLAPSADAMFDEFVRAIASNYPQQIVVVEGHVSASTPLTNVARTHHAISASRAAMVVEQLLMRGIPPHQLRVMGHGAAQPQSGSIDDERIELVVYPEKFSIHVQAAQS